MADFMKLCKEESHDAGYTDVDIAKCGQIVDSFMSSMALRTASDEEQIRRKVKTTVLALNTLNEKGLIETREREILCELIEQAGIAVRFYPDKDVTDECREW